MPRLVLLFATVFFLPFASHAEPQRNGTFPGALGSDPWLNRPNDPKYPEMWQLFSHIPVDHRGVIAEGQVAGGSGLHVDRAWQLHTGEPSTLIAVLDSGIRWHDSDLIERHFLNVKELPLPEGSQVYDANGDGRVSVSDYANDSRVRDFNGNGVIDAGDLIAAFSNGKDEDGNGFVDDIAGWDFHENDNDPGDRTNFGHGTGEAKDSVAEINNGIGGAGICGNCTFIALRVDDSFVVDANSFAAAVAYATKIGASMIQQALGSFNNSPFVQMAIDYAYDNNVPIIGSAADEASYHHNYPSTLDPIIYTNAIRYDSPDFRDATTFLNFNNCSNYGARVDVATSGRSCSSEATGNLSGITGLTLSYLKHLGRSATAGQIISLIKSSADDINLGPNINDPDRYSTFAGWDIMTGYGRSNAYSMLDAVRTNRLPPESRIQSPQWFEVFNQDSFAGVNVKYSYGKLPNSHSVVMEIAHGVETHNIVWSTIPTIDGADSVIIYPEVFSMIPRATGLLPRDKFAYTIRLRVTDAQGLVGESRRTIYVIQDYYLKPGFPQKLLGSGEGTGYFKDLDGDGADEYITADGAGWIHAYTHLGGEVDGFPTRGAVSRHSPTKHGWPEAYSSIFAPIAGGDMDGDGHWEIVYASAEGAIGIIEQNGIHRQGFPVLIPIPDWSRAKSKEEIALGILSSPVLADLDNDGVDEIVVAAMDGKIHAYRMTGDVLSGFPVQLDVDGVLAKSVASPSIADLNGDGVLDIVVGTNHVGNAAGTLFVVDGRGTNAPKLYLPGFPRKIPLTRDSVLPTVGTGIPTSVVIADFNRDRKLEILVHGFLGKAYLVGPTGTLLGSYSIGIPENSVTSEDTMFTAFGHPSVARLSSDGPIHPVMVGVGRNMLLSMLVGGKKVDFDHLVGIWNPDTMNLVPGYPRLMDDMQLGSSFVSGDFDGDGRDEIIGGSGGHFIRGFSERGEMPGFPHFTGGWTYGSPSIGDFDGDGQLDVAASTREGFLFIWGTEWASQQSKTWPNYKFDTKRTGKFGGIQK